MINLNSFGPTEAALLAQSVATVLATGLAVGCCEYLEWLVRMRLKP